MNRVVFWTSSGLICLILAISVAATESVGGLFLSVQQAIVDQLGWLYVLSMTGFLVFTVWLMQSRFGGIRLGRDDEEPEFSTPTWFAMLFSAGMGIVLFFVTSSDSASLVVDTIASGGQEYPPVRQRVFWAVLEGLVAAVLLFAGGLKALQAGAISTALPFCLVIIAMCVSLVRGLRSEAGA